jgi:hypothetical protein
MPQYFFNIVEGHEIIHDEEGSDLPDLDAARAEATEAARQIMSQSVLKGHAIDGRKFVITDEAGATVLEFPFQDAIGSG